MITALTVLGAWVIGSVLLGPVVGSGLRRTGISSDDDPTGAGVPTGSPARGQHLRLAAAAGPRRTA